MRGCTDHATNAQSILAHTYSLIRGNKQNRRGFLRALLRHFEDYEVHAYLYCFTYVFHLPGGGGGGGGGGGSIGCVYSMCVICKEPN